MVNLQITPIERVENFLPHVFRYEPASQRSTTLLPPDSRNHLVRYIDELSYLNAVDIEGCKTMFQELLTHTWAGPEAALLWAGLSRSYSLEGNYLHSAGLLGRALHQLDQSPADIQAFVLTEVGSLLGMWRAWSLSSQIFTQALTRVETDSLRLLLQYKREVGLVRSDHTHPIGQLESYAERFLSRKDYYLAAFVYKNVGVSLAERDDLDGAEQSYAFARQLAQDHTFEQLDLAIRNDVGFLMVRRNDLDPARTIFQLVLEKSGSRYQRSLALENLGYTYFLQAEYLRASGYFTRALDIARDEGVLNHVTADAYFLGICHERLGNATQAREYLRLAAEDALKYLDLGIDLTGYRRKAVDTYLHFLEGQDPAKMTSPPYKDFSFARDQRWGDLKGTFQETALNYHGSRSSTVNELCRRLKIPKQTYFSLKKRLARGALKAPSLQAQMLPFIQQHRSLDWRTLNRKFEQQVYRELLQSYYGNKTVMAQKLAVSYAQVLLKTKAEFLNEV